MDRAPSGWVRCRCGFESSPFKSSARGPSVEVYVSAPRIDRKNARSGTYILYLYPYVYVYVYVYFYA